MRKESRERRASRERQRGLARKRLAAVVRASISPICQLRRPLRAKRANQKTAALIALGVLSACGFQPLHGHEFRQSTTVNLTNVRIETDRSRLGELLRAEIEDGANPSGMPTEKLYILYISSPERDVALFINPDGTSSRGDLVYDTTYTLTRLADSKLIHKGAISRISSYNSSVSADYASFVSQQDARKRAVLELAQDYKLRLANVMTALNTSKPEDLLPDPNAPKPVDIIQSPNLDEINAKRY